MTTWTRIGVLAAAVLALPGYKCGNILDDNGFDLWCGDELCSWQVEVGDVERAPTWHERDYGVELVGDEVVISQLATDRGIECLRFELIADVEPDVAVTLELDFYDDGVVDHRQAIPSADWELVTYPVVLPESYQGIRVRIVKQGAGRAVLGDIAAIDTDDCVGQPVELGPGPKGAFCDGADDCVSGICAPGVSTGLGVCARCTGDADCPAGQVCGAAQRPPMFLEPYRACVEPGSRVLGQICASDGECATGICCEGVCSTCCGEQDCDAGRACAPREPGGDLDYWTTPPHQCEPQGGAGAAGTACLSGDDCASGRCEGPGPLRVCLRDGRACAQDADCPPDWLDLGAGGIGHCVEVGTAGGVCE